MRLMVHIKEIPFTEYYGSFEAFVKDRFSDEWDEDAQDWGYWVINFKSEDYHTHSWLTLQELVSADYKNYLARKYKIDKDFVDAFKHFGGRFPEKFWFQKSAVGDIRDAFSEAMSPTVTICWMDENKDNSQLPVFKGIEDLKNIAKKYGIKNYEDIRIVFAFDN